MKKIFILILTILSIGSYAQENKQHYLNKVYVDSSGKHNVAATLDVVNGVVHTNVGIFPLGEFTALEQYGNKCIVTIYGDKKGDHVVFINYRKESMFDLIYISNNGVTRYWYVSLISDSRFPK